MTNYGGWTDYYLCDVDELLLAIAKFENADELRVLTLDADDLDNIQGGKLYVSKLKNDVIILTKGENRLSIHAVLSSLAGAGNDDKPEH